MRGAFSVLLLANLLVGGYLLSKSSPRKRKGEKGDSSEKEAKPLAVEAVSEQKQPVHSDSSRMESTEHVPSPEIPTDTVSLTFSRSQLPTELTAADRQKLLEWMLEAKRKERFQSGAEKVQNDADKRLIKDVLRGKTSWHPLCSSGSS
eukprot:SM000044S15912  [mRNA]  locus=s44:83193:83908:+ [translate_table: standard]